MSALVSILIVDDEVNTGEGLARFLKTQGYDTVSVTSAEQALSAITPDRVPDIILSDIRMAGGMSGLELLQEVKKREISSTVIMMTAYGTVANAVDAMQQGAYHYLTKPLNLDELLIVVKKALSLRSLENENKELKKKLFHVAQEDFIVGASPAFKKVYEEAAQVASSNASVLIQGESGTGKELIAQFIHNNSVRKNAVFMPVHCAALSESLLESELFGHEKGAFTGASSRKIGRFEEAHGGTIFLDEIGEIDQKTQVKLLRVLQDGSFERVGSTATMQADIRLIAATNKNLLEEVQQGRFREDLYYRINVIMLQVPPLRERTKDIREIFDHYIKKFAIENQKKIETIDPTVYDILQKYHWAGNIRELKNISERIIVLLKKPHITLDDMPHEIRFFGQDGSGGSNRFAEEETIADLAKEAIKRALVSNKGNKTKAATALGISRRTLYRKMDEFDLK